MAAQDLSGVYTRQSDGKTLAYRGTFEEGRYQVRVYPADEPPQDVSALPIAFQGDLSVLPHGNHINVARNTVLTNLEDWNP